MDMVVEKRKRKNTDEFNYCENLINPVKRRRSCEASLFSVDLQRMPSQGPREVQEEMVIEEEKTKESIQNKTMK